MSEDAEALRAAIYANMFDGQQGGNISIPVDRLVDEMVECVSYWLEHIPAALVVPGDVVPWHGPEGLGTVSIKQDTWLDCRNDLSENLRCPRCNRPLDLAAIGQKRYGNGWKGESYCFGCAVAEQDGEVGG